MDGRFKDEERLYSAIDRAKIIHNEVVKQNAKHRIDVMGFSGNNEYFTLGYLAKNGYCTAQVPLSEHKGFENKYNEITKDNAQNYLNSMGYQISKDDSKWHLELGIRFPTPDPSIAPKISLKHVNINNTSVGNIINNNQFVWNLFKIGFKLGKQDINKIKSYIPNTYMGDFEAGMGV